ncbi:NUDIX hydrolase [Candidatus Roizmanbacteria bacterium]|nr:NUDIX hydrolase [Candidatus Roizmanbacteria bacterium]
MRNWKRITSQLIIDTKHFKIRKDILELPNKEIKEWIYWESGDSAMVVGMTKDKKLVMIRQYRYLVGDTVLEFPSGSINNNEKPEDGARRELTEETGYICGRLYSLGSFYETYGQLNRKIHLYFSSDLTKTKQHLDRGTRGFEEIKIELVSYDKAIDLAVNNKIVALGSSLAVLLLKAKIDNKEISL